MRPPIYIRLQMPVYSTFTRPHTAIDRTSHTKTDLGLLTPRSAQVPRFTLHRASRILPTIHMASRGSVQYIQGLRGSFRQTKGFKGPVRNTQASRVQSTIHRPQGYGPLYTGPQESSPSNTGSQRFSPPYTGPHVTSYNIQRFMGQVHHIYMPQGSGPPYTGSWVSAVPYK